MENALPGRGLNMMQKTPFFRFKHMQILIFWLNTAAAVPISSPAVVQVGPQSIAAQHTHRRTPLVPSRCRNISSGFVASFRPVECRRQGCCPCCGLRVCFVVPGAMVKHLATYKFQVKVDRIE